MDIPRPSDERLTTDDETDDCSSVKQMLSEVRSSAQAGVRAR